MVFNFTHDFQFNTIDSTWTTTTKLLGTNINLDLSWYANTEMLVKKAYQRMLMLHKLYSFHIGDEKQDLERVQKVFHLGTSKDKMQAHQVHNRASTHGFIPYRKSTRLDDMFRTPQSQGK